ncbi:MAG: hypothetical protein PVF29_17660 [Desulfobacterales bacterium]
MDEMTAAVRGGRQRGFKTMVHANGKAPVKIALDAGCDSIEQIIYNGKLINYNNKNIK